MSNSLAPPWAGIPAVGPLLRPAAAAEYLGLSKATYYAKAATGVFPVPLKIADGAASGVPQRWLDAIVARAAEGGVQ